MKEAAVFDIDDTLLNGNTGRIYAKVFFRAGIIRLQDVLIFAKFFLSYRMNRLNYAKAMEKTYALIKDWDVKKIVSLIENNHAKLVRPLISKKMMEELNRHKRQGRKIILATNSWYEMVAPVAKDVGADIVLATEAEKKKGIFTGNLKNSCHGKKKMERVIETAKKHNIDLKKSYAYSDHHSDWWMLSSVGKPVAVTPNRKLRKYAIEKKWRVIDSK
ncbi:MAG: HAD family hydrolase [Nanoarchaeota archaeon]